MCKKKGGFLNKDFLFCITRILLLFWGNIQLHSVLALG